MNNPVVNLKILEALNNIKERKLDPIDYEDWGICPLVRNELRRITSNVVDRMVADQYWIDTRLTLFREWDEFSGDDYYPVPAPLEYEFLDGKGAYYSDFPMWDEGEYAATRERLLDYLIIKFKEKCDV